MEGRQRDGTVWRMLPVWLLAGVLAGGASGASRCWVHPSCQDLDSESSMMECVELCRTDANANANANAEIPLVPGDAHLQPPSDPESTASSSPSSQAKRSYSMEHFRWGKPVGRKRRPIKVYTSNSVGEESAEVYPGEMRRQLAEEMMAAEERDKEQGVSQEEPEVVAGGAHQKKNGAYQMKHFRWSDPPESKRYGGFMRSWDEHSQRPLLTLFKNVINKDGQQQK